MFYLIDNGIISLLHIFISKKLRRRTTTEKSGFGEREVGGGVVVVWASESCEREVSGGTMVI